MRRLAPWCAYHWQRLRHTDGGYGTEAVLVIALLVVLALAAVALISDAVMDRAESISLE